MSCCGVDNYKDFSAISTTQIIPRACCVLKGDKKNLTPQFPECTTEPSAVNSYYMTVSNRLLLFFIHKYTTYRLNGVISKMY